MSTSVVLDADELETFLVGTEAVLGDPSAATCLLIARWGDAGKTDNEVLAIWDGPRREILLGLPTLGWLPISIDAKEVVIEGRALKSFHVRKVWSGVWALSPSLNLPGVFHGYLVLSGVPEPAPWERLVILSTEL